MSRARFGLMIALLILVVAAATFAIGVAVLDDDGPDTPPDRSDEAATAATTPAGAGSTTTAAPPRPADGPVWIAVVSSEGSEDEAAARAREVEEAGLPAGVLRSDDHESLTPGLWVAYAGPYPSAAEAEDAVGRLEQAGIEGAYARCAGTDEQCS